MRASSIIAASVALVAGANAHYSYDNVTYTTEVVTAYTTVCPTPTEIVHGSQTYTVTESTVLTITNCPCTVTKPVYTAPVFQSSAYIPSTVVYTTPVATIATIASSSPVPYTSTFPVPYTSNEVVYTSSIPVVSTSTSIISIQISSIVQVPTTAVEVPTTAVEVPTSAVEVPTSAAEVPTSSVVVPTIPVVPTTRGPVPLIPVYPNATSTYVAPPAGTATGGVPAATTTSKVFLGAANKAFVASGASLAGLLGLAAILL